MIKVSVMYPNAADAKFDMGYYLSSHMPMVKQSLGMTLKGVSVDEGLGGGQPGSPPKFLVMCHLFFDSIDSFQMAMATHGGAIMADVPNYTNTQPIIQVNNVKL